MEVKDLGEKKKNRWIAITLCVLLGWIGAILADKFYDVHTMSDDYLKGKIKKNRKTAFLLCLFLGMLGAHKFYDGKIIQGILCIVFVAIPSAVLVILFSESVGFVASLFVVSRIIQAVFISISIFLILLKPNPYYV